MEGGFEMQWILHIALDIGTKCHSQSRDPGKNVRPSAIQNCPRTVDCAAVEVRGQFWMARGRTFLPGARDWCDILTLYPSKSNLYLISYYTNRTVIMDRDYEKICLFRVVALRPQGHLTCQGKISRKIRGKP